MVIVKVTTHWGDYKALAEVQTPLSTRLLR